MRIKTWANVFMGLLILSIFYLIISAFPPVVMLGVYVGEGCVALSGALFLVARHMVKQGRGEERRPG